MRYKISRNGADLRAVPGLSREQLVLPEPAVVGDPEVPVAAPARRPSRLRLRLITGRFELDAIGWLASEPQARDRHVSVSGSFSATAGTSSRRTACLPA